MKTSGGSARRGRTTRIALLGLCAVAAVALASCQRTYTTYRYKMTLSFSVYGQVHTGSSVVQITPTVFDTIDGGSAKDYKKGQATIVDLGNGKIVLGLLSGEPKWTGTTTGVLGNLYRLPIDLGDDGTSVRRLAQQTETVSVPIDMLPPLITFEDPHRPDSYRQVDPYRPEDVLGNGVKFLGATVQITNESITTGIAERLPWLKANLGSIDGASACVRPICVIKTDLIEGDK